MHIWTTTRYCYTIDVYRPMNTRKDRARMNKNKRETGKSSGTMIIVIENVQEVISAR